MQMEIEQPAARHGRAGTEKEEPKPTAVSSSHGLLAGMLDGSVTQ